MEIKTTEDIVTLSRETFNTELEEETGLIKWVRVDDVENIEKKLCQDIEDYSVMSFKFKNNVKLLIHKRFYNELSQSNEL